jgi:hypothetical protein
VSKCRFDWIRQRGNNGIGYLVDTDATRQGAAAALRIEPGGCALAAVLVEDLGGECLVLIALAG